MEITRAIHLQASGHKLITSWGQEEIMESPKSFLQSCCTVRHWSCNTNTEMKPNCYFFIEWQFLRFSKCGENTTKKSAQTAPAPLLFWLPNKMQAVGDESKENCDIVDLKPTVFHLCGGPQYITGGPGK